MCVCVCGFRTEKQSSHSTLALAGSTQPASFHITPVLSSETNSVGEPQRPGFPLRAERGRTGPARALHTTLVSKQHQGPLTKCTILRTTDSEETLLAL